MDLTQLAHQYMRKTALKPRSLNFLWIRTIFVNFILVMDFRECCVILCFIATLLVVVWIQPRSYEQIFCRAFDFELTALFRELKIHQHLRFWRVWKKNWGQKKQVLFLASPGHEFRQEKIRLSRKYAYYFRLWVLVIKVYNSYCI